MYEIEDEGLDESGRARIILTCTKKFIRYLLIYSSGIRLKYICVYFKIYGYP